MAHKQKWIKVNAPVDEEIAEVVEALSLFPGLQTIQSCQAGNDRAAWVCFVYGSYWEDPWKELAEFVCKYLGTKLAELVGDAVSTSIQITESETIRGELSIRPGMIDATASAIKQLARSFTH